MRLWTTTSRAASILVVLAGYVLFATTGRMEFRRIDWRESVYADLAEGFLRGQLSLASEPSPELRALSDPYRGENRENVPYIWDASYYDGRYYLYFSPLPLLLFTVPFFFVARGYPPDALVTVFFTSWAFLASTAFILWARRGARWRIPAPLWIVALGLGGYVPYVLTVADAPYQVAVSCGMAMTATWACALLAYLERPTMGRAAIVALFVGLSVAARPNLAPLVAVTAVLLWRHTEPLHRKQNFAVWLLPLAVIAAALMTYNYARFRHPLEFGVRYQLGADLIGDRVCGISSGAEAVRFVNMLGHHVLQPPTFAGDFPWVNLAWSRVDLRVSPGSEQAGGIAALIPLTLIASVILLAGYGRDRSAGGVAATYVIAGSWVILLALSTCWFIASRYSLDYAMLMAAGTVVSIEAILATESGAQVRLRIASVAFILYSVVVGTLLGFVGPYDAFKSQNPALLARITAALPGRHPQTPPPLAETVRLRGWAIHVEGPLEMTVENRDGTAAEGAQVTRLPSLALYEYFATRWKRFPPLRHAKFEIYAPSLDNDLVLSFRGLEVQRIPLRSYPAIALHPDVRLAIDEFEVTPKQR
jgi:hypothetical protein